MKNTLKTDLNKYANELANAPMIDDSHFFDFRNNIFGGKMSEEFVKMFMEGDGSELISKACAVHSSSMLGYNFFHWISNEQPFIHDNIKYTKVLFEVKIRVLNRSPKPANMDIVLTNDNNDILFIESKFLEYLHSQKFSISDTYKNKSDSYFYKGNEWCNFIKNYDTSTKSHYWDGIKQEICHLIGLMNWTNGLIINNISSFKEAKDIKFINLVFEPNEKEYKTEHDAFNNYKKLYNDLHKKLKESNLISGKLKMCFMSYSDLWPDVKKCISDELKQYLEQHYMKFAYKKP